MSACVIKIWFSILMTSKKAMTIEAIWNGRPISEFTNIFSLKKSSELIVGVHAMRLLIIIMLSSKCVSHQYHVIMEFILIKNVTAEDLDISL